MVQTILLDEFLGVWIEKWEEEDRLVGFFVDLYLAESPVALLTPDPVASVEVPWHDAKGD